MENEVNSTKLIIKKVEVFDESVYGSNNGKLLITLNGENVNSSLYKISYGLHTATNLFNSNGHKAINNTIVFDNIKNGEYFNLYITKLSDNTISNVVLGFFTKSAIRSIADNNQNTNAVATLCPSINFTDCAGAAKTVTNFNTESAGNIQGSYNPCGFEIGTTCAVTKVSQWHCIDGNLSLPAAFSVYTKTNYVGVGLTALQACRLNYIVCNYVFNASGVADAVWYITGTGGSNTAVAQAAVNAVPAVNGTQDLMTFYKYPNGTAQDMIDWTCRSVDNCTCPNNLVVNPSFESGTTGWSWSGGTLSAGNGAAKCGNYSGDFQISNTATNWVSQTVGTDLPVGTVINASVWAGTHNNSINHKVLIEFFDANWNWISGTYVDVNKVLSTAPAGPQLYTLSGVVPPGCKYSNIGFNGNGDWIKTDQWCVTTAAPTTVALGNEVFVDTNGNGVKDGGDWGYDGVLVKLYLDANQDNVPDGAALASQTTSGGGKYNFSNLAPGNYMVQIENAPSWMFVVPRNGGDPDNNIDNDNNGLSQATTTIKGGTITLSVGGEPGSSSYNPTYDFAIYKNNGLGDFVFLDADADGIQDAGEAGIANVTVKLKNTAGTVLATTTTDATGYYYFYDPAQYGTFTYNIEFVTPAGYSPSPSNQGADDTKDSDPIGGTISNVNVPNGTWNYTLDAGFFTTPCNARVTSLYFNKLDGGADLPITNGAVFTSLQLGSLYNLEAGTTGTVGSVKYTITGPTPSSNIENSTPYNSPGSGAWTGAAGTYSVNLKTYSNFGAAGTLCHDTTISFILDPATGSIGDRVWFDANGNGIQDATETTGIAGVTVQLRNSAGTVIATTTTNGSGNYLFTGLVAGNYTVAFPVSISGAVVTTQNVGADDNVDSDASQATGITPTIVLGAAQNITNVDAGYCPTTLVIGNYVWEDRNNNGIQDASEPGVNGATVRLYVDNNNDNVPDGASIANTTTNATGNYTFNNLAPGNYIVGIVIPSGYVVATTTATSADPNNDNNTDNNGVTTVSGEVRSNKITLVAGTEPSTDGDGTDGNLTLDFGLFGTGSIGDFVFVDVNGNGLQDAGETGISNATVTLGLPDGSTRITTTDASGLYSFTNLAPGTYSVTFTTPAAYTPTTSNAGGDDTKDSDPVAGVVTGIAVNGNANTTIDAGFYQLLSLGDRVYIDLNDNGVRDATEVGLAGVTVNLYLDANNDNIADGGVIQTTTTDVNGSYRFNNLVPNNYIVGATVSAGYRSSTLTGVDPDNNTDLDDNGNNTVVAGEVRGNAITLTVGAETLENGNYNHTYDFGFVGTGSIGDFVFVDANANGLQDGGELGIPNATVTLTYPDGTVVTTTTNATGNYLFSNLPPTAAGQSYTVTFTTPAGYTPTTSNVGANDAIDSDPISGVVSGITLTAGQSNTTIDAGFYQLVNLGNNVWYDRNNNGTKDAGEPAIVGATVNLYADANNDNIADGAAVATTTTIAGGAYAFSSLVPGNYIVGVVIPAGYAVQTINGGDPDNNTDNDNNGLTLVSGEVRSNTVTLSSGGEPATGVDGDGTNGNLTVDFGFKGTASIGDLVFVDANGNGLQDGGVEVGIPNATVTLTYPDGTTATTTTDANGLYSFTNLAPTPAAGQTYSVTFTTPAGYTSTTSNVGANDAIDSDPISGVVSGITLTAGQSNTTIDAGFYQLLSLGNFVWDDKNNNGIQDAGEPGINGATVNLYRDANGDNVPDGTSIGTTTTSGGGLYGFGSLTPGNYIVGVVIPAGYVVSSTTATSATPNNDNLLDNNGVTTVSGEVRSNNITLSSAGEPINDGDGNLANQTLDFGLRSIASVGDKVWRDDNKNGVQDAGEPGVSGITVSLFDNTNKLVGTTVTDAYGNYLFSNLPAGDYTVSVTLPANYTFTTSTGTSETNATNSDVNAITGNTTTITLSPGENQLNIDAGIIFNNPPATANIGDRVWLDTNKDGIQTAGEPGVAGVTVTLFDNTGAIVATAVTDANGNYLFTNVPAGTGYTIGFTAPAGTVFSPKDATADGNDSDADPVTGKTAPFTVVAGTTDLSFDAGVYPQPAAKASLGDKVFNDLNKDGKQDAGEPGIAGVTVNLYASNGTTLLGTTKTDAFGNYIFTNLDAGTYVVEFVKPSGYTNSTKDAGTDDTKDSDADATTGKTAGVVLAAGDRNTTVDAGMYVTTPAGTLVLGDKVFNDENRDGVQAATEDGVSGVTVTLYQNGVDGLPNTADDVKVKATTTDVNGNYLFTDLAASSGASTNYSVQFSNLPNGYSFTTQDQTLSGGNDTNDSDPNTVTGRTGSINLTANNLTVDAGIVQGVAAGKGSLGDRVFYDMPGGTTGVQDATEQGVAGVIVKLYKDANNDGTISGAETTAVATTTTNALGNYMFGGLDAGNYQVGFSNLPSAFTLTTKDAGTDDAKDSDGNPLGSGVAGNTATTGTSYTGLVSLAQGEDNLTVDLGIVPPANTNSLGGDVWKDTNNDGNQTAGEPAVKGVMVTLYDATGNPIATTVTDDNGKYLFVGLPDGSYSVGFSSLPAGYNFTTQSATNDATGSDANVTTGRTTTVTLGVGNRNDTSLDAGLVTTRAALGDYVWFDTNGNGTQDATESGIAGVTVTLTRPGFGLDGVAGNADDALAVATAITDATGKYFFGNLAVGNYVVNFATIPNNTVFTQQNTPGDNGNNTNSDANPANGNSASIVLTAGETDLTIDAGVKPNLPGAVGDYVWNDLDGNGVQGANEPGVAGVLVTLYNASNVAVGSAITDGSGKYLITNIPAGTGYYVVFSNLQTGAIFTTQTSNVTPTDATLGSDANPADGKTASFTIVAGETLPTVDAGIKTNILNLGNFVWYDKNSNGLQDAGELGLAGIPVSLYKDDNADNIPDGAAIATTTTGVGGIYNFANLTAGNYIVGVIANTSGVGIIPSFTTPSSVAPNNDNNLDNNGITIVGTEIRSNFITLSANVEPDTPVDGDGTNGNLTVDFGIKGTGSLGNFVWDDLNRNGIQDSGEPGISGATVTLTYPDGSTSTTTTNASGAYSFTDLVPGTYSVAFTIPTGSYVPTGSNLGTDDGLDSDPVSGVVSNVNIAAGQTDNTIDAGFYRVLTLQGNVWHDVNGMDDNLVNNTGPLQIPAAATIPVGLRVVRVNASTGLVVSNASVLPNGTFSFGNVAPGTYILILSQVPGTPGQPPPFAGLPSSWVNTGEKLGLNPGRDAVIDGKLGVNVTTANVINANFAIKLTNADGGID